jgi:mannan endo-1,4-beta-mannosidase
LSGQESEQAPATTSTAGDRQPAIFTSELGTTAEDRAAIVKAALRAHAQQAEIRLSWHAAWPTNNAPASVHGSLSDYEWSQLLTPGSALNQQWNVQIDGLAATLRELDKAGIAVLFTPLPEANGKDFWWAGRKGIHGSSQLYRQLFDRLVNHDGLHNLLWVWEFAAPGGNREAGMPTDYFPGLLFVDGVEERVDHFEPWNPPNDRPLRMVGAGKPMGLVMNGEILSPDVLTSSAWSWFVAAPSPTANNGGANRVESLHKLFADPRVVSLPGK